MKKLFTILAVAMCSTLAMAQTKQYFWANGRFIMGNPIDQIDSITFGQLENTDSITLYMPHTIKVVHDTIIQYVTIHDTICPDGHQYVDLGLSVKWATCNVGATKPEEYGDFFAWGETKGYSADLFPLNWNQYVHYNKISGEITKYCNDNYYGVVDNILTLEDMDDAATANWGSQWRMPTHAEQQELKDSCIWARAILNGVSGFTVTGKNGSSIFLPTTGAISQEGYVYEGNSTHLWSSTLNSSNSTCAIDMDVWEIDNIRTVDDDSYRYFGQIIRAVCK